MSVITFKYWDKISNVFTGKTYWIASLLILSFSFAFVVRNYIYEPIFDFRPYHIGANLVDKMEVEEGKGRIEESVFIYSKDGVEKEFTEDNYPWEDSTWVFVSMDTRVLQEGEVPEIKDLSLTKLSFSNTKDEIVGEEDITQAVLSDSNYTFLMISPTLEKLNHNYLSHLEDVQYYSIENGYHFYCLTASVSEDILKFVEENSVSFNFCSVDERVLKTMTRTNPGLLLLKDGIVVNKWADIEVPAEENLQQPLAQSELTRPLSKGEEDSRNLYGIILIFFLPLALLKLLDFLVYRKRKKTEEQTA